MTKAELCAKLAEKSDMTKADAERALNAILDIVEAELKAGEKVTMTGFGTFQVNDRAARIGRNPQTGAEIKIPASKVVKFKAGKALADAMK